MTTWIVRAALRLVPRDWRGAVGEELRETAEQERRGAVWIAWQVSRAGLRLRSAITLDNLWFDGQHAVRSLMRAPWFTAGAILTFALGIGVNVAVFTAVDRMLFRTLPYERPNELVVMREFDRSRPGMVAGPFLNGRPLGLVATPFVAIAQQHSGFAGLSLAGFSATFFLSPDTADTPPLRLTNVTHTALSVYGVRVIRGRDFTAEDITHKRRLALISFDLWKQRFGGDPERHWASALVWTSVGRDCWRTAPVLHPGVRVSSIPIPTVSSSTRRWISRTCPVPASLRRTCASGLASRSRVHRQSSMSWSRQPLANRRRCNRHRSV